MTNPRTIARIASRIQERAAYCLQFEIRDPRATFVTITRVELSNDLGIATIHYSVLGDEGDRSKAAHMLDHAVGYVQRQVARVLHMRRVPNLRFAYDDSIEHAAAMDRLIREARDRDRRIDSTLAEREANEARIAAEDEARETAEREAVRRAERIADGEIEDDSLEDGEVDDADPPPDPAAPNGSDNARPGRTRESR